ncbi:hypothetical protein PROFUN_00308 [Planoprotostelium fungivorum]|uniref:EamA domain-containing protein n=1 Tax=Planoprotostelium fungivorum TaxID=1890364 RepID=A0A2P6NY18_9EUKA|nr:hypothetical protein PROFUN_00308 [Planoprotostelium fungivorum]
MDKGRTAEPTEEEVTIDVELEDLTTEDEIETLEMKPDEKVFIHDVPKWKQILNRVWPLCLAMMAAFFFSLMTFTVKKVSAYTPTFQVALFRSIIQGAIAITMLWVQEKKTPFDVSRRILWIVASRGTIGFVSFVSLFFAVKMLPLSECVVIAFTHPVFVALLAAIFLKERWHLLDAFGTFMSLVGVILIAKPSFLFPTPDDATDIEDNTRLIGLTLAGVNSILTAVVICLVRSMGANIHVLQNVSWFSMVSAVLAGIISLITRQFVVPQDWMQWGQMLLMGIFAFMGQYCNSRSLQLEKAAVVATMGYLQVPFATMFDIFFFDYSPNILTTTGIFMVCSLAVLNLVKQWVSFKEGPSIYDRFRLWLMNRSTRHHKLSQDDVPITDKIPTKDVIDNLS